MFIVLLSSKYVIVSVAVVAALKSIRVSETELLIEYHSPTALFVHILITILGFHVLSWKVALLELETHTVLAQHLREQMTFDLLDEIEYRISKYKVAFVGWMSMQV